MLINKFLRFLILTVLISISANSFSDEETKTEPLTETKTDTESKTDAESKVEVFKISEESLNSLNAHLSEEKFELLKSLLLKKEYIPETMDLIDSLKEKEFSDEEVERAKNSIALYFEVLEKINLIAPLISSINQVKQDIEKKETMLDSLMNNEKEEVSEKIDELKVQLTTYQKSFKVALQTLELNDINFDKLPGMLADLGYEDSFYQVMYEQLSSYLSIAKKLAAATSIIKSLEKVADDISLIERDLKKAETEEQKTLIAADLKKQIEHKKVLEQDFTLNVTGIDQKNVEEKKSDKIDWEEELKKIFSPVIINLKELTEPARKIELLNTEIAYYEVHLPKIQKGIEQIELLFNESHNKKTKKELGLEKEVWVQQEKELSTKFEVAKQQLAELESRKISPEQAMDALSNTVFSKQTKNILLSILAFFSVFIALHLLRRLLLLINPLSYIPRLKFVANIIDVILNILIFIVSILTLMIALYLGGSMMALAIVAFILVGMLWTLRNTLPHFTEQIKLLLGYGPVRQGEKVIYNGIQWQVKSIGGYSYISNPLLTGNLVRLPLKDLIHLRSRPYNKKEPWFPTREGDWVILSDGFYGNIIVQTPDIVQLNTLRGSVKSYTPSDFLKQRPQNLSANLFSVNNILNLDFRHSDIVIEEVSEKVTAMLKEKIEQEFYGKYLTRLFVQLKDFDNSSLNVVTIAQFSGEAASEYTEIGWLLQQVALDACNKYGWKISYNQVALHQVKPMASSLENQPLENHSLESQPLESQPSGELSPE